jgi:hypothetical protein
MELFSELLYNDGEQLDRGHGTPFSGGGNTLFRRREHPLPGAGTPCSAGGNTLFRGREHPVPGAAPPRSGDGNTLLRGGNTLFRGRDNPVPGAGTPCSGGRNALFRSAFPAVWRFLCGRGPVCCFCFFLLFFTHGILQWLLLVAASCPPFFFGSVTFQCHASACSYPSFWPKKH